MKLHRIEIDNLNSLYGEHVIDLERDLRDAPLFLVHGPTGSGKSTLLDAVSLALFGETPRLSKGRASGEVDDDDSRNVLSRGTGACRATVEFSTTRGGVRDRYRATWTCQRAHQRPDGRFQAPVRTLEQHNPLRDGWDLHVSDTRVKVYEPVFSEVLEGMTVADFKRSVLLAQGEFAAFLKASEDERAAILERLTDTSTYKALGQRAAAIRRAAEARLKTLDARLDEVDLLPPEQEASLREQREEVEVAVAQGRVALRALEQAHANVERRQRLIARLETARADLAGAPGASHALEAEIAELQGRLVAATAARDEARRAWTTLEPDVVRARELSAALAEARQAAARDEAARNRARAELDRRHGLAARATSARVQAEAHLTEATRAREAVEPDRVLIDREGPLRAAWEAIATSRAALDRRRGAWSVAAAGLRDLAGRIARQKGELVALRPELDQARAAMEAGEAGVVDAAGNADPDELLLALPEQAEALRRREAELDALARALEDAREARRAVSAATEAEAHAEAALGQAEDERLEAIAAVEGTQGALTDQQALLEELSWALSLGEERDRLAEGRACPLCGSTHHPYAADAHVDLDERLAARAANLRTEVARLSATLSEHRSAADATARRVGSAEALRAARHEQAGSRRAEQTRAEEEVARARAAAGLPETVDADGVRARREALQAERRAIEVRAREVRERLRDRDAARRAHGQVQDRSAKLERALATDVATAAERQRQRSEEERAMLSEQQSLASAELDLAAELDALGIAGDATGPRLDALEARAARWRAAEAELAAAEVALKQAAAAAKAADDLLEAAAVAVADAQAAAEASLARNQGLSADLALLRGDRDLAALENAARAALSTTASDVDRLTDALSQARASLARAQAQRAALAATVQALNQELAEVPESEEPLDDLATARTTLDDLLRNLGGLDLRLAHQDEARKGRRALFEERERALDVAQLWQRMHKLIGERDGDRFKLFAQVLNLGELLDRANKRLDTLAPRYRLAPARDRDGDARLGFAVIDRFQANQVRPLTTLSGGETFLVSLALALALADYRMVRMPIETLLLDEGFGTLDDETLTVALEALGQLQATGTTVGIISHIPSLRDRIEARVVVTPIGNGRSVIRAEMS